MCALSCMPLCGSSTCRSLAVGPSTSNGSGATCVYQQQHTTRTTFEKKLDAVLQTSLSIWSSKDPPRTWESWGAQMQSSQLSPQKAHMCTIAPSPTEIPAGHGSPLDETEHAGCPHVPKHLTCRLLNISPPRALFPICCHQCIGFNAAGTIPHTHLLAARLLCLASQRRSSPLGALHTAHATAAAAAAAATVAPVAAQRQQRSVTMWHRMGLHHPSRLAKLKMAAPGLHSCVCLLCGLFCTWSHPSFFPSMHHLCCICFIMCPTRTLAHQACPLEVDGCTILLPCKPNVDEKLITPTLLPLLPLALYLVWMLDTGNEHQLSPGTVTTHRCAHPVCCLCRVHLFVHLWCCVVCRVHPLVEALTVNNPAGSNLPHTTGRGAVSNNLGSGVLRTERRRRGGGGVI